MNNTNTNDAVIRSSFISEFAYGNKHRAMKALLQAARATQRFDGIDDAFIYEGVVKEEFRIEEILSDSNAQSLAC